MDGLEAMEINLSVCKSIIDFRIDASTYQKEYVRTDEILRKLNPSTIEREMKTIQNFGAYSLCNDIVFTDEGIPFLMTQNVRHNYIDWNNIRHIDDSSHKMLYKSHCQKNQVLITMAGEYLGRVAVYDKDFICSSNQAIAKVTLKKDISPYYVSTFLNSRYGQNQINRFKTITGQPNINMGLIKSLLIPTYSNSFYEVITEVVMSANNQFSKSESLISQADAILADDIGTCDYIESQEKYTVASFSVSSSLYARLDSEYYQGKYGDYNNLLKNYYNGCGMIGDICTIKDKNFNPDDKTEYFYIELANVGQQGNISACDRIYGNNLPTRARRVVSTNDVIVSSVEGSLSKCALITPEYNGYVCSNGFYVINCNFINSETLLILFKSKPIQALMKRGCSGTILSAIGKDELLRIPLPIVQVDIQEKIKKLVEASIMARKEGERLLDKAVKIIESAIEHGEETTIKEYNQWR